MNLTDKAIITGSASGIGRATAEIHFVRDLPRDAMGKVMRCRLDVDPIETEAGASVAGRLR